MFVDRNHKKDFVPIVILTGLTNITFIRCYCSLLLLASSLSITLVLLDFQIRHMRSGAVYCYCGRIGIIFVDQSEMETESRNGAMSKQLFILKFCKPETENEPKQTSVAFINSIVELMLSFS